VLFRPHLFCEMTTDKPRAVTRRRRDQYLDYLKSGHWKSLRQDALKTTDHLCAACASAFSIDVHHLVYRNLYDCTTSDVMPLCRKCHYAVHKSERLRAMKAATALEKRTAILDHIKKLRGPSLGEAQRIWERVKDKRKTLPPKSNISKQEFISFVRMSVQIKEVRDRIRKREEKLRSIEKRNRLKLLRLERNAVSLPLPFIDSMSDQLSLEALVFLSKKLSKRLHSSLLITTN